MLPKPTLRPYQLDAVNAVARAWQRGCPAPLVSLPTGTGKSLVAAEIVRLAGSQRVLVVTHVAELLVQNQAALLKLCPEADTGLYCAGLARKEANAQVVFGSVASLARNPSVIGRRDVVLVDEAHLVPPGADAMYQRLIVGLRAMAPMLVVGGLTATPFRLGSGLLTSPYRGRPAMFSEIVYEAKLADMIGAGHLSPLVSKGTGTRIDTAGVRVRAGEFANNELEAAINTAQLNVPIVDEIIARGANRRAWVIFCVSVAHVREVTKLLKARGVKCAAIVGSTPADEREAAVADFKSGKLRALVNCNVLTTGFDAPAVDLIAALRPTKSPGLWLQMLGRGMRLAPGKDNCLVLDFAGNVKRLGPATEIDGEAIGGPADLTKKKLDLARECPECMELLPIAAMVCTACGHAFPPPEPAIVLEPTPTELHVLIDRDAVWYDVDRVAYRIHEKPDRPPTLRISYFVRGMADPIVVWRAFEGDSVLHWAARWWREQGGGGPIPSTAVEAYDRRHELRPPKSIRARPDGRFWKINGQADQQMAA